MFGQHFLIIMTYRQQGQSFFHLYIKQISGGEGQLFDLVGAIVEADLEADGAALQEVWFYAKAGKEVVQLFDT